jgi:hypothetical protein
MLARLRERARKGRHHHRAAQHGAYTLRKLSSIQTILLHGVVLRSSVSMAAIIRPPESRRKLCEGIGGMA